MVPHRARRRSARFLLVLGLLVVLSGLIPTPAAGASPPDRRLLYGIAGHAWWLDQHLDRFVAAYHDLGITSVRLSIDWKRIEPQPGVYQWDLYDRVLQRLVDERLTIVGVFVTVPAWAATNTAGCDIDEREPQTCDLRPDQVDAFERVARATLVRYPFIRHWEFWNEPELWVHVGSDVGVYLTWLDRFYRIAKQVDPSLQVAAATLAGWDYIGWLYDTADAWYGADHRPWDAVAFHPYNPHERDDNGALLGVRQTAIDRLREGMVERGDAHKSIWITEYGWEEPPATQAVLLRQTIRFFQSRDYIAMAHLHMLHDWQRERYGLLKTVPDVFGFGPIEHTTRFEPKEPFYSAFRSLRRPGPPPPPAGISLPPTGHLIDPHFAPLLSGAGAAMIGQPLTRAFWERRASGDYALVQYTEQTRLEWTVDGLSRGLLGDQVLQRLGWLDAWGQPLHPATARQPRTSAPNALYFDETGHSLAGPFRAAWEAAGGLPALGYPRTEVLREQASDGTVRLIQYAQRGRLEQLLTNGSSPVTLAPLGTEALQARGWLDSHRRPRAIFLNPAHPAYQL